MSKNRNIFVTSDVWFNRPMGEFSSMTNHEYNDMIIENWNNMVSKKDIVYVLGGFGIGDCYDIVLKLNGEHMDYNTQMQTQEDIPHSPPRHSKPILKARLLSRTKYKGTLLPFDDLYFQHQRIQTKD